MPEPAQRLETSDDLFLGGALTIRQPLKGHRAGIDAVFLAAAAPANAGDSVLDAGAGPGTVGLCIARRVAGCRVSQIEIEPVLADLARGNAERNGLADRVRVFCADLTAPLSEIEAMRLGRESFDHVVANPPFHVESAGRISPEPLRRRANAIRAGGLDHWLRFAAAMAKPGGTLTVIHRPEALPELLGGLEGRFASLRVYPLFPRAGAPANRIMIAAVKGSRAPLVLLPGMVLHEADGHAFRPEAAAILRHGAPLNLHG
jgi:tRNA1(Val) A37 N6-methylase TrmN6